MAEALHQQEELTPERLAHYRDHPEEIDGTNLELLEALSAGEMAAALADNQVVQAKKEVDTPAEGAANEAAKPATPAKAAGEGQQPESEEGKPIATKDGKHTLPFEVLKDARERAAAAEDALAEAQQTALQLADQVKAMRAGRTTAAPQEAHSTEELQALVDRVGADAPWLKEAFGQLVAVTNELRQEVQDLRGRSDETDAQQIERLQDESKTAIDANPTLVLWQEKSPGLWGEAVKFDQMIRRDPDLAAEYPDFNSRYAAVVEMVKARHVGQSIPLPDPIRGQPNDAGKPSQNTQARAQAALAKADEATSVRTLSDIPGGAPAQSPEENLERMDAVQVAERFARMKTPQEILQWVNAQR